MLVPFFANLRLGYCIRDNVHTRVPSPLWCERPEVTRPVRPRGPMSGARPRRKTNLICFDCTKGVLALTGQWNALLSWCTPPGQCTLLQCNVPVVPGIVGGGAPGICSMYVLQIDGYVGKRHAPAATESSAARRPVPGEWRCTQVDVIA